MDKNYLDLIQVLGDKKEKEKKIYVPSWKNASLVHENQRSEVTVWKRFL